MTAAPQVPLTPQLELADPEESPTRSLSGFWARFVSLTALGLAAFVLYTSGFGPWPNLMNRALFLAFAFVLTLGLYPLVKGRRGGVSPLDVLAMAVGVAACAYIVVQVIIGTITLTGVGVKLSELLIAASGGSLITALVLTALICTALGMGVTTTADYIFAAAVIGAALLVLVWAKQRFFPAPAVSVA